MSRTQREGHSKPRKSVSEYCQNIWTGWGGRRLSWSSRQEAGDEKECDLQDN